MAISYGTNLAGASQGAYAVFPATDPAGAGTIEIFDADVGTGVVTAVAGGVPLTALQAGALSGILKGLLPIGTVAGNELEYLRKLVGVLPLVAGDTVTLAVANVGGNVWRLTASLAAAGTVIVYVPNAAATGPFTGDGASSGSSAPPSGAAGGVLGYPGSTYPDPSGLATIADAIPVHGPGTGATITLQPDASVGTAVDGDDLAIAGAEGSAGTVGDPAGAGGSLDLTGGDAGANGGGGAAPGGLVNIDGGRNSSSNNRASVKIGASGRSVVEIGSASKPHGFLILRSDMIFPSTGGAVNANPFAIPVESGFGFIATSSTLGAPAAGVMDAPLAAGQIFLVVNRSGQDLTFASGATQKVGNAGARTVQDGGSIQFYAAEAGTWYEIAFTDATV